MVFPSVPIYLDPPNWPQQSGGGSCDQNNHHQLLPPPACAVGESPGGGTSSVRSVTMTDRARIAKIPHPETSLKCPRCESTNTKFCYFNNYSLTQPRHLCKTCRRYWTRGGSLRNVPVGGGCRRNKRSGSKSSTRSKSPATTTGPENNNNYISALPPAPTSGSDVMMTSHFPPQPSFMNQYGSLSTSFGGIQVRGNGNSHDDDNINNDVEFQWRLQQQHQFPFMMNNNNGMEATPATGNMYTAFESEGDAGIESYGNDNDNDNNSSQIIGCKALDTSISSSVKVEGNNNGILNLSRNFLGISNGGDHQNQYWGGNAWTELARFTNSSSSTRNLL